MALISLAARERSFSRSRGWRSARVAVSAARVRVAMVNSTSVSVRSKKSTWMRSVTAVKRRATMRSRTASPCCSAVMKRYSLCSKRRLFLIEKGDPGLVLLDPLELGEAGEDERSGGGGGAERGGEQGQDGLVDGYSGFLVAGELGGAAGRRTSRGRRGSYRACPPRDPGKWRRDPPWPPPGRRAGRGKRHCGRRDPFHPRSRACWCRR